MLEIMICKIYFHNFSTLKLIGKGLLWLDDNPRLSENEPAFRAQRLIEILFAYRGIQNEVAVRHMV